MEILQRLTRRQLDALQAVSVGGATGPGVTLVSVAAALKVRPPSALEHLTLLETWGLVARYRGKSRLTPRGWRTLAEYQRHHRIAEGLFRRMGLSVEETCRAAREVDRAISHRTIERLCAAEGHPRACPHGEPIPACRVSPQRG